MTCTHTYLPIKTPRMEYGPGGIPHTFYHTQECEKCGFIKHTTER